MYAIPRKKRKSKTIEKCGKLFSKYMSERNYKKASLIVFYNVLVDFGKEGIMNALDDGNSFFERRKLRKGL